MQHAVYVVLDGKERPLRLQLGAWAALQDRGHKLEDLLTAWQEDVGNYQTLQLLLWAMLQNGDKPWPTMDEVGEWVGAQNVGEVLTAMGKCLRASLPTNGNGSSPPRKAARGTGTKRAAQPSVPSD